jgi:hypothetical protein
MFWVGYFAWEEYYFSRLPYSPEIVQVLRKAGNNRPELEKVLEHYSRNQADSLKYKAACFLIENMPCHYELNSNAFDSLKSNMSRHPEAGTLEYCKQRFGSFSDNYTVKEDVKHITADYLIKNIEFSFKVWQESPWNNNISFDDFCEEILPYRVSYEAIEDWKETYYQTFHPLIEPIVQYGLDSVCGYLCTNSGKWTHLVELNVAPGIGALTTLKSMMGGCKGQSEFFTYLMRSLGIPTGMETLVQHINSDHSIHVWNYVNAGRERFYIEDINFYKKRSDVLPRKYGKVYRLCYAVQRDTPAANTAATNIPPALGSPLLKDMSNEYFPDNVMVNLDRQSGKKGDWVYLSAYTRSQQWMPLAWSKRDADRVTFRNVESNALYRVTKYIHNRNVPISEPFLFKGDTTIFLVEADREHPSDMMLTRKFMMEFYWKTYLSWAVGGRFQGANRVDFGDAVDLHTIADTANMMWAYVPVQHQDRFRYVRYLSAPGGRNTMAEIQFMSHGHALQGAVIGGLDSAWDNHVKENVFDGNPLTYFEALAPDGSWVGLAFDSPQKMEQIRYLFRNDDNSIRQGDEYELLYWNEGQWVSAGQQTGDTSFLLYKQIPSKTMYWLRNHTRGREERPFTYANGKQIFW